MGLGRAFLSGDLIEEPGRQGHSVSLVYRRIAGYEKVPRRGEKGSGEGGKGLYLGIQRRNICSEGLNRYEGSDKRRMDIGEEGATLTK